MAIKNIIARGIGFTPGSIKFIVTHGFIAGIAIIIPDVLTTTSGVRVSGSGGRIGVAGSGGRTGVSGSGGRKTMKGSSG